MFYHLQHWFSSGRNLRLSVWERRPGWVGLERKRKEQKDWKIRILAQRFPNVKWVPLESTVFPGRVPPALLTWKSRWGDQASGFWGLEDIVDRTHSTSGILWNKKIAFSILYLFSFISFSCQYAVYSNKIMCPFLSSRISYFILKYLLFSECKSNSVEMH